jgi:hypothetical protein
MIRPLALAVVVLVSLAAPVLAIDPDAVRYLLGKSRAHVENNYGQPQEVRIRTFDGQRAELWDYPSRGMTVIFVRGRVAHVDAYDTQPTTGPRPATPPPSPIVATPDQLDRVDRNRKEALGRALTALVSQAEAALSRLGRGTPKEFASDAGTLRRQLQSIRETYRADLQGGSGEAATNAVTRALGAMSAAAAAWDRQLVIEQYLPGAQALVATARGAEATERARNLATTKQEHATAVSQRQAQTLAAEQAVKEAAASLAVVEKK